MLGIVIVATRSCGTENHLKTGPLSGFPDDHPPVTRGEIVSMG